MRRLLRLRLVLRLVVATVVIVAILTWAAAIAAAVTAYVKREQWTLPAYRWMKDRSGRLRDAPWTSASEPAAVAEEMEAVEEETAT